MPPDPRSDAREQRWTIVETLNGSEFLYESGTRIVGLNCTDVVPAARLAEAEAGFAVAIERLNEQRDRLRRERDDYRDLAGCDVADALRDAEARLAEVEHELKRLRRPDGVCVNCGTVGFGGPAHACGGGDAGEVAPIRDLIHAFNVENPSLEAECVEIGEENERLTADLERAREALEEITDVDLVTSTTYPAAVKRIARAALDSLAASSPTTTEVRDGAQS